jgi:hypothetical protein
MVRSLTLALLLWIVCAPRTLAEGNICPDGYYEIGGGNAGWIGCAAYDVAPGQPQPDPGPLWVSRWGAIAVDGDAGKFGGKDGLQSKRKAERAAVRECQKFGGKKCKVVVSYRNQCGAMAWGDNMSSSASGPNLDYTMERVVADCNTKTQNCKPYYAGCSYPERVR